MSEWPDLLSISTRNPSLALQGEAHKKTGHFWNVPALKCHSFKAQVVKVQPVSPTLASSTSRDRLLHPPCLNVCLKKSIMPTLGHTGGNVACCGPSSSPEAPNPQHVFAFFKKRWWLEGTRERYCSFRRGSRVNLCKYIDKIQRNRT